MAIRTKKFSIFSKENAQTMVEFAIVFPIVLLITYGIIEFGRLVFIYAAVTGAAREGARYGAAAGSIEGSSNIKYYMDCVGIRNAVRRGAILTPITDDDIRVWYDHGPGTAHFPNPDPLANLCPPKKDVIVLNGPEQIYRGDRIGVHIEVQYQPIIPFLGVNGFTIASENARTILVYVDIQN